MKIDISVEVSESGVPLVSIGHIEQAPENAVIPQVCYCSAPALEVRTLGDGRISQKQMLEELAKLGPGWRLETRQELYALVDLGHKNSNGAFTRDETLLAEPYWTADMHPLDPAARVVVWFDDGGVGSYGDHYRARARAVRVVGQ